VVFIVGTDSKGNSIFYELSSIYAPTKSVPKSAQLTAAGFQTYTYVGGAGSAIQSLDKVNQIEILQGILQPADPVDSQTTIFGGLTLNGKAVPAPSPTVVNCPSPF